MVDLNPLVVLAMIVFSGIGATVVWFLYELLTALFEWLAGRRGKGGEDKGPIVFISAGVLAMAVALVLVLKFACSIPGLCH
jgi:hypothetical protein